jgi:hypothetical protein
MAGSVTSSMTLKLAMFELMKNQRVMQKEQQEV